MSNDKSIAFFYPTTTIGGAQLLFARLAAEMIERGRKVVVVDLEDGFITSYLSDRGLRYKKYLYEEGITTQVHEDVCMIQHLSSYPTLGKKVSLTEASELLFWSIHPFNIFAFFNFTPFYTRAPYSVSRIVSRYLEPRRWHKVNNWIEVADKAGGLYYMDGSNLAPTRALGLAVSEKQFLPIPISEKEPGRSGKVDKSKIQVAWIGRVTDEKVYPFQHLVSQLEASTYATEIVLHVVGYGALDVLESATSIAVVRHGVLGGNELDTLLYNEIDLVVAMGTSVLEAAVLGIPTALTDVSKRPFPMNYKYKWVFESRDFDLGTNAKDASGTLTINDILGSVTEEDNWRTIGSRCRRYAVENHSMNGVVDQVLEAVNSCDFSNKILKQLV